ncbi:AAA family ATPase [Natrinema longum]|uniref:AAA family ATPase n=1 Tax=Natrinema longum TaxID=370324 RepID=UPI001CCA1D59|nr:ATP-binding protein [Natrinema longum]MBZ6497183.1 ATP-binding protein [Natrinema longum]
MTSNRSRVILFTGLPAGGKSTIANSVGRVFTQPVISSEDIRSNLFEIGPQSSDRDFSPRELKIVYRAIGLCVRLQLSSGVGVSIVDGVFRDSDQRQMIFDIADDFDSEVYVFHIVCEEETALERLERRSQQSTTAPAGPDTYHKLKEEFIHPSHENLVEINTTEQSISESVHKVIDNISLSAGEYNE